MSGINVQNKLPEVTNSTEIPVYANNYAATLSMTVFQLVEFINSQSGANSGLVTQYSNPTATGFNINVENNFNTWLIVRPLGSYAAGTLTLPATPVNLQSVNIVITADVTTLTVNGNGNSVIGSPASISANDVFSLRYDGVNKTWFRN